MGLVLVSVGAGKRLREQEMMRTNGKQEGDRRKTYHRLLVKEKSEGLSRKGGNKTEEKKGYISHRNNVSGHFPVLLVLVSNWSFEFLLK